MIRPARLSGAVLIWAALSAAALADIAAITSQNAGALTLLETGDWTVVATVPLPGKPAAVAVDAARDRVLAVAVETKRLHVFDLTGRPLATHDLPGAPFGIAVLPGNGHALITDWTGALHEVDPASGDTLRRWTTGATPSGVATDGALIVTADRDANAVTIIRGTTVSHLAVGEHPFGVTLHDGRAYVTNVLGNSVSVIDLGTDRVIATIPTGERPYAVAFAAGKGYVSNQYAASVTVFDSTTHAPLAEIETGDYPEGIAATAEDRHILVANWFSDSLTVIDTATDTAVQEIAMPEGPRAFGAFIANR